MTFVFAKPLSYVVAPGFSASARPELVKCIRILCVIPPVMVFATIAQGLLRQKKCFIVVNSRSLCLSLCGMFVVLVFSVRYPDNADILCYGYVAANLIFTLLLFFRSRSFGKLGYTRPRFDEDTKKLFIMAVPAIISKGVVRISLMIDQVIASTIGKGAVSHLNYAHSLYNIVNSLLIVNLCVIMLTDFTNLCVKKQFSEMVDKLHSSVSSILLLLAPVSLLTICFSREIVAIAYQRGAFKADSTEAVRGLLLIYAICFVPAMFNSMYTQVLHAFGKMRIAMMITVVSFALNIVISILLSKFIGIIGIAVGTTASAVIIVPFYKRAIKNSLPGFRSAITLKYVLKLLGGLSGCLLTIAAAKLFIRSHILSFAVATVVGFAAYIGILLLLNEETTMRYLQKLKKVGKA